MQFHAKAVRGDEPVVSLAFHAADEVEATAHLQSQGYSVLSLARNRLYWSSWTKRAGAFPTLAFSEQLLSLLEAGLSLIEALEALRAKEERLEAKRVVAEILESLYRGQAFSSAVARFPTHFSALYTASVKASEKTGDLPHALRRYITYREQMNAVRSKVISASIYPSVLLAVGSLVLAFLLFYVVPRFSLVYADISTELPFFSAILLKLGNFITSYGWMIAVAMLALGLITTYTVLVPTNRAMFVRRVKKIPGLGAKIRIYEHARLYRTLGMLLRGGIPIIQALDMSSGLASVESREHLSRAITMIREGKSISTALSAAGFTSPVTGRMLLVGERSGNMAEMMERIAEFCDKELARWVEWFTKLFEPVLMAAIGILIGFIVVMMYMPIFELTNSVQ